MCRWFPLCSAEGFYLPQLLRISHPAPWLSECQGKLTLDDNWRSSLELYMHRNLLKFSVRQSWGLHRRCTTNSLFQVNSRQGQGLLRVPTCWTQSEKGKWKVTSKRAESKNQGGEASGSSISSRQETDNTAFWCPSLRTRRASRVLAATKAPPLGDAISAYFSSLSESSSNFSPRPNSLEILLKWKFFPVGLG